MKKIIMVSAIAACCAMPLMASAATTETPAHIALYELKFAAPAVGKMAAGQTKNPSTQYQRYLTVNIQPIPVQGNNAICHGGIGVNPCNNTQSVTAMMGENYWPYPAQAACKGFGWCSDTSTQGGSLVILKDAWNATYTTVSAMVTYADAGQNTLKTLNPSTCSLGAFVPGATKLEVEVTMNGVCEVVMK